MSDLLTEHKAEKQRARERMRYVKPKIAGKVLGHHRYWTRQFLDLYLQRCDETAYKAPPDAYLLAQHLPEVARRVRVGETAKEWDTPLNKMGGIVMALAVKGTCCRSRGEYDEAALCFSRAVKGIGPHKISPRVLGELQRREAELLTATGRGDEARDKLADAHAHAKSAEDDENLADCLALGSYLFREQDVAAALQYSIETLRVASLKSWRGLHAAETAFFHCLGTLSKGNVPLVEQERALKLLQQTKNALKGTPTSARKLRVLWLEGRLLSGLKIARHAARQMGKARKGLKELPKDNALISLDLIEHYVGEVEYEEARELAIELRQTLDELDLGPEPLRIVNRWCVGQFAPESEGEIGDLRGILIRRPYETSFFMTATSTNHDS